MKKFNVGIQLYGVRNAMAEDFYGTLKAVKDMGYDYVEFAGYYNKSAEEINVITEYLKYEEYLAKWNGELPSVVTGDSATIMIPTP